MHWLALDGLDTPSQGWPAAIRAAGYDGVQFIEPLDAGLVEAVRAEGLRVCGSGRVNRSEDAYRLAAEGAAAGLECLTIHLGWGIEDDDEAYRLIEAVLDAASVERLPLFVEIHRATLFQDIWRSVGFVGRFPELRLNGDFSHWYTGLELPYGDFTHKLAFMRPVIDRIDFMHGRIGDGGAIQVGLGTLEDALALPFVEHFRQLWGAVFRSFLDRHGPNAEFPFAPELLSSRIFYARTLDGREYSDRWEQSRLLVRLAERWLDEAAA